MRIATTLILMALTMIVANVAHSNPTKPHFVGFWSKKDPGGIGGMYYDQSWGGLVARWNELGQNNQYLADVEMYRDGNSWRYAGLWRVGPRNGALYLQSEAEFVKTWKLLKKTQNLIDLEIVQTENGLRYLGVWRQKANPNSGDGGLLIGLTWDDLVQRWQSLGTNSFLVDVETYVIGGKRLYTGVWSVGKGNGALYRTTNWREFTKVKQSRNAKQKLQDFDMYQTEDGKWNFLGVWRFSKRAGPLYASSSDNSFKPFTFAEIISHRNRLKSSKTMVGLSVATPSILRGDTTCQFGDLDCNKCAINVEAQFSAGMNQSWVKGSWVFSGKAKYPPNNLQPKNEFQSIDKHIQGLVRTNSARYPYAGSHSHRKKGSIFFVRNNKYTSSGNADNVLHSLHRSNKAHPSGVAVLGDGLFVAESGYLRWFGINAAGDSQNQRYMVPEMSTAGGGLGLAKLSDGTSLLIVSHHGGGFRKGITKKQRKENLEPRYTRFYKMAPDAFRPDQSGGIHLLGKQTHNVETKPSRPYAYSENLSVVTECGTGSIYTVHTTGDWGLRGDGYWRLSKLEGNLQTPHLVHKSTKRKNQHHEYCHHRSSATVHVNKNGKLEFLCSERAVTKKQPSGRFNFRRSIVR